MKKIIYALALLTLLLLPVQPALALGPSLQGRVIIGQNFTLKAGETLTGDLVIIGNAGAEMDTRGYVTAYHVSDGSEAWRFWTILHATQARTPSRMSSRSSTSPK